MVVLASDNLNCGSDVLLRACPKNDKLPLNQHLYYCCNLTQPIIKYRKSAVFAYYMIGQGVSNILWKMPLLQMIKFENSGIRTVVEWNFGIFLYFRGVYAI